MKSIPNTGSFPALIKSGAVYVDKTQSIAELISYGKVFFARPRRFGKSLALNAVATLFEKGVEPYFKDTWIYNHWTDVTYPVMHLSFVGLQTSSFEEFEQLFCGTINAFAKKQGLTLSPLESTPASYVNALLECYDVEHQLVIVIDEYDCMLTAHMNNEAEYTKYANCMRSFYGALKDKPQIRFLGITGVTRLKNVSLFSVGSEIIDATYDKKLATLTGYTREEILRFFKEYILDIVNTLNGLFLTLEDITDDNTYVKALLDRLADEYDGYCFDSMYEQKVFSTWSINRFFFNNFKSKRIDFGDYWFDNGGMPSILKNFLETHNLNVNEYSCHNHISPTYGEFTDPTSLLEISPSVLMCQTGYLTLRSELKFGYPLNLGIPNHEIRKALANQLYFKIAKRDVGLSFEQRDMLAHGSPEQIFELLNALFGSVSYENYPVRDEATLRYPLQCFFMGAGVSVVPEKQNFKGRADLELEFSDRRIIFELKYVNDSKDADKALEQAVTQIKDRNYGNTLPLKKELLRLALVFDGSKPQRKFICMQEV